jgi:hypothetical protein
MWNVFLSVEIIHFEKKVSIDTRYRTFGIKGINIARVFQD